MSEPVLLDRHHRKRRAAHEESNGPKPRKVSASNVAPGTYGLLIANFAAVDESERSLDRRR